MSSITYYPIIGAFLATLCVHDILPFMFMFMFVSDQNNIYKFKALLPKDYYLIPENGAINLFVDQTYMYTNLQRYHQRTII